MAIEITGRSSNNSPTPIKTPTKATAGGESKVANAPITKDDSVALTAATQEIKKTVASSNSTPVDIDRVSAIKRALADGSYSINADKVAKKLLDFEQILPQEDST